MRGVTYSKLVFLDSQDGVRGAKALRPTFTVPSNDFSVGNEESIRLTLKSFSMPVQYYGINRVRAVAGVHPRVETMLLSRRSSPCTVRIICACSGRRIEDDVYVVLV
jgi:hypothetical protein